MGWLFGCFGCGGGTTSPRSRAGRRHKSSSHALSPHPRSVAATATASTTRPWPKHGECISVDSNGLQHLRIRDRDQHWQSVEPPEQAKVFKSSNIPRHPQVVQEVKQRPRDLLFDELLVDGRNTSLEAPRWDSSPDYSPVSASGTPDRDKCVPRLPASSTVDTETVPEDRCDKSIPVLQPAESTVSADANPKPVSAEPVSLSLLPKTPGFFMPPRKRSFAYRSSMWQEPLSPVAEAESSVSSEKEEEDEALDEADKLPSQSIELSESSRRSFSSCDVHEEGSEADITPVHCLSPVVEKKNVEARKLHSKDKENAFLCKSQIEADNRQDSVLTPVGNVLQWRQLKEEQWRREKRAAEGMEEDQADKASSSNELEEVEPENYTFFSELQWRSTQITPQLRPASRWDGDSSMRIPNLWDGQGIPNTNRKYKEDQQVTWHSTPFETRIDKALASSRQLRGPDVAAAPRMTLF